MCFFGRFCSILLSATGRRLKSIENGTEPFLCETDSHLADFFSLYKPFTYHNKNVNKYISCGSRVLHLATTLAIHFCSLQHDTLWMVLMRNLYNDF